MDCYAYYYHFPATHISPRDPAQPLSTCLRRSEPGIVVECASCSIYKIRRSTDFYRVVLSKHRTSCRDPRLCDASCTATIQLAFRIIALPDGASCIQGSRCDCLK